MNAGSAAKVLAAWTEGATQRALLAERLRRTSPARDPAPRLGAERGRTMPPASPVCPPRPRFHGEVIAAISVSGPIDRMGRRPGARWAADLLAAADAIQKRLTAGDA